MREVKQTWPQEDITKWAQQTFGPVDPLVVAERMKEEVEEMITDLKNGKLSDAAKEACDVGIMLRQVAQLLGQDLDIGIDQKMEVNIKRTWAMRPDGGFQHVD